MRATIFAVGAALVMSLGIRGMHRTVLPGFLLDSGQAMILEKITPQASRAGQAFIEAVMTMEVVPNEAGGYTVPRLSHPVSLERVTQ